MLGYWLWVCAVTVGHPLLGNGVLCCGSDVGVCSDIGVLVCCGLGQWCAVTVALMLGYWCAVGLV